MENHSGPPIYYIIALMVGFFPWSIFFLPFLIDLVRSCKSESEAQDPRVFAICWIGVVVGLFTLASTKLPSYITPCYPALAVLMGDFIHRLADSKAKIANFWPYVSYSVLGFVGLAVAIAIPVAATQFIPDIEWLGVIGVVLVIGAVASSILWRKQLAQRSVQVMLTTSALFVALLMGWGAYKVGKRQKIESLMTAMRSRSSRPTLRTLGTMRSSWVFYGAPRCERRLVMANWKRSDLSPTTPIIS